jgi:hypothetical protein
MALSLWGSVGESRRREARARLYVEHLMADPPADIVLRLAAAGDADEDHARWELRYALRAIGYLVSERDALDDRTSAEVAHAIDDAQEADPNVARDRRAVAQRQFNERLRDYRAALADRTATAAPAERIGRVLLRYARSASPSNADARFAAEVVAELIAQCNAALREAYGEASLPVDTAPSELLRGREDEKTGRRGG